MNTSNQSELREKQRDWLAEHGFPYDYVEGDILLDYIAEQTDKAVEEYKQSELKRFENRGQHSE